MSDRVSVSRAASDDQSRSLVRSRESSADSALGFAPDVAAPTTPPQRLAPVGRRGAELLALQRVIGNQAVQRLLERESAAPGRQAPVALRGVPAPAVGRDFDEDVELEDADLTDEAGLDEAAGADDGDGAGDDPGDRPVSRQTDPEASDNDILVEDPGDTEVALGPGDASQAGPVQRKSDPSAMQTGPLVIQRAGRAVAIRNGLKKVGGGLKKVGQGTWKGAKYLTKVGIKDNTGVQNKVGKVAGNVAEGLFNAMVGPASPRWWYKAYSDIKGIKKEDYGAGASARVFQVLAVASQLVQKIGTTAGVLSLVLAIAGAALGAAMGAGAACALGSAVCGLIAFIASCTSFVLQSILVIGNAIKHGGYSGIKNDPARKARFIGDIASMIGSAIGVVGGGLGVNWGGGAGLFNSGASSVVESGTQGIATVGQSSSGLLVGQQFANFSIGQLAGSASDTISETAGALSRKEDPAAVQREDEKEGGESEGGEPDVDELKGGIAKLLGGLRESREDDDQSAEEMKSSVEAVDKVNEIMATPASATGVKPPSGVTPPDMPVSAGVGSMPGKLDEATQSIDSIEKDVSQTNKYSKKDSARLDKADSDVTSAEEKLGITGEPAKKPGVFKRMKDWLVSKVLNIKARIKKIAAAAKAKLVSIAISVMGISKDFEELKETSAEDRESSVDEIEGAAASSEAADQAEEKAEEFSSKLG